MSDCTRYSLELEINLIGTHVNEGIRLFIFTNPDHKYFTAKLHALYRINTFISKRSTSETQAIDLNSHRLLH